MFWLSFALLFVYCCCLVVVVLGEFDIFGCNFFLVWIWFLIGWFCIDGRVGIVCCNCLVRSEVILS